MIAFLSQESDGAGGRDNTEALVYRIGQIYKKADETNKTIWAVKKEFAKKKKDDDEEW